MTLIMTLSLFLEKPTICIWLQNCAMCTGVQLILTALEQQQQPQDHFKRILKDICFKTEKKLLTKY